MKQDLPEDAEELRVNICSRGGPCLHTTHFKTTSCWCWWFSAVFFQILYRLAYLIQANVHWSSSAYLSVHFSHYFRQSFQHIVSQNNVRESEHKRLIGYGQWFSDSELRQPRSLGICLKPRSRQCISVLRCKDDQTPSFVMTSRHASHFKDFALLVAPILARRRLISARPTFCPKRTAILANNES